MDIKKFGKIISNNLRLEILSILTEHDNISAKKIYELLNKNKPKYRQSVNKSLDILTDSGLIKKVYDNKKKRIVYSLKASKVQINFKTMSISSSLEK